MNDLLNRVKVVRDAAIKAGKKKRVTESKAEKPTGANDQEKEDSIKSKFSTWVKHVNVEVEEITGMNMGDLSIEDHPALRTMFINGSDPGHAAEEILRITEEEEDAEDNDIDDDLLERFGFKSDVSQLDRQKTGKSKTGIMSILGDEKSYGCGLGDDGMDFDSLCKDLVGDME